MKAGDLVTWSSFYEAWNLSVGWVKNELLEKGFTRHDKCGIIIDKNPIYFFVLWEDGSTLAHEPRDLENIGGVSATRG